MKEEEEEEEIVTGGEIPQEAGRVIAALLTRRLGFRLHLLLLLALLHADRDCLDLGVGRRQEMGNV